MHLHEGAVGRANPRIVDRVDLNVHLSRDWEGDCECVWFFNPLDHLPGAFQPRSTRKSGENTGSLRCSIARIEPRIGRGKRLTVRGKREMYFSDHLLPSFLRAVPGRFSRLTPRHRRSLTIGVVLLAIYREIIFTVPTVGIMLFAGRGQGV